MNSLKYVIRQDLSQNKQAIITRPI